MVLPMRQTVLAAKQAAEVDALSGGRLRFGIGVGYVPREYEALHEDYHTRGARIEEQMAVMRALWTEQVVTFNGRWHQLSGTRISPLPVQRPIPLWIGGMSERAIRRTGALADGWIPTLVAPDDRAKGLIALPWGTAEGA